MFAAVYRYKVDRRVDEAIRLGHNEFVPMIKNIPGFVAHYALNLGNDEGLLLSVFENEAGIKRFSEIAEDWVQKRIVPTLGAPYDQPPLQFAVSKIKAYNTQHDAKLQLDPPPGHQ